MLAKAPSHPQQPQPVPLHALRFVGSGLVRPECVLATRSGALYTADWRGGVAMTVRRDGSQTEKVNGVLSVASTIRSMTSR
jgi:hypothetical protein